MTNIFGVEVSDTSLYDHRYNHETLTSLIGWQLHNSQYGHKQTPPQWLLDAIRIWFAPIPDEDGFGFDERLAAVDTLIGDHGNNIAPYPKNEWVYAVKAWAALTVPREPVPQPEGLQPLPYPLVTEADCAEWLLRRRGVKTRTTYSFPTTGAFRLGGGPGGECFCTTPHPPHQLNHSLDNLHIPSEVDEANCGGKFCRGISGPELEITFDVDRGGSVSSVILIEGSWRCK